jgi:hypothetical protein
MIHWIRSIAALSACLVSLTTLAADPAYFSKYPSLKMSREQGVLVVEMNSAGKALKFSATEHEAYPDAFYAISRDRDNKVVILTGAAGDWMGPHRILPVGQRDCCGKEFSTKGGGLAAEGIAA